MRQGKILYGGLRSLQRELDGEEWRSARYTILLDENTFQFCLAHLVASVEAFHEAEFIEVPVGEECKSLEVASQVWQSLLEGGAGRDAVLVCLGGGAVCDLGGFVAAGFKRGIRHINIPTTLLSMVDASIGGKTAVDFGGVKNSVGFFYPSVLTVIEPAFLDTLPPVHAACGLMEMLKTAAVCDPALYEALVAPASFAAVEKKHIAQVARLKRRVVNADPYDHGIRRILNFGHTFGHAIETFCNLPHGMAVGIGMRVAMYLSVRKTGLDMAVYDVYSQWLRDVLSMLGMAYPSFNLKDVEQMLALMRHDKKCADGELRCVLLQEIGAAVIDVPLSDNEVRDAFLHM